MNMRIMLDRHFLAVALVVVLCGGLEACPYIGSGCTFDSTDCKSLTCTTNVLTKTITTNIKLNTCKTEISATVTVEEGSSGVYFTHNFYGKGDVPIPGLNFGSFASANIRFRVYRSGSNVMLEVDLVLKSFFTSDQSFNIINAQLGQLSSCSILDSSWFSSLPVGFKALIIGGSIAVFLCIIGCIACCCCGCCGCCKESTPGVVVSPGFHPQPTHVVMENMPEITTPYKKF